MNSETTSTSNLGYSPTGKDNELDANILDIEEAIYSSELILTYIAQEGIEIEEGILQTIVEAQRKIKEGPILVETEVKFWMAFNKLTDKIKPVTILSLKSSLGTYEFNRKEKKKRPLKSQKAVFKYGLLAVLTLLSLMVLQIYWLIGGKTVDGLLECFDERASIQSELENLKYVNQNQVGKYELTRLKKAYKIADQKLDAQYRLLTSWNGIWHSLLFMSAPEADITEFNKFKYKNEMEAIDAELEYLLSEQPSEESRKLQQERTAIMQQMEEDKARQKMFLSIFSAQSVLNALQQYFLPLSYGLLGAITFILRTLSVQVNLHTYSHESEIDFRLKLALGALTGMAVGWFFPSELSDSELPGSFSPLALAFLFGYNVDIFFAIMDQFVSRINTFVKSKTAAVSSDNAKS